jgi:thiopeptide-type bacteriocin biosynthesis protein
LREVIGPCVREAISAGAADRWFFIRYSDPAPHLRLRLHGDAETLQRAVWPALQKAIGPWLDEGRIWRVVLDTYEREVERYGGAEGIVLAERLFHADSEAVLEIVELLDPGDAGLDERWRLTLCGMDRLLDDLGIELGARRSMLSEARAAFGKEFRSDRALDRQIGEKFRKERPNLSDLLDPVRKGEDSPLGPGLEILGQRSERLRPIVADLKSCEAACRLSGTRHEIAMSYLHMHANRLLRSVQREQELVLYDFLARHYESALARTKPGRAG